MSQAEAFADLDTEAPPRGGGAGEARCQSLLACLVQVARYFDRPVGLAEIAALSPVRDGPVTPQTFRLLAQRLGLRTRSLLVGLPQLTETPLPFVLSDRGGAWPHLVLDRGPRDLFVLDPISGERSVLAIETALDCDVLIAVQPPDAAVEEDARYGIHGRLLRGSRGLVLAALSGLLLVLAPAILLLWLHQASPLFGPLDGLQLLGAGLLAVYGIEALLQGLRAGLCNGPGRRLEGFLDSEMAPRLLALPYRSFETQASAILGDRLARLETLRRFVAGEMPPLLLDLVLLPLFLLALVFVSLPAACVVAVTIPLFLLLSRAAEQSPGTADTTSYEKAGGDTPRTPRLDEIASLKALGLEAIADQGLRVGLVSGPAARAGALSGVAAALAGCLQHAALLAVVYIGASGLTGDSLGLAGVVFGALLAARVLVPLRKATLSVSFLRQVWSALRWLDVVLQSSPAASKACAGTATEILGDITFDDVTVQLAPERPPVLRNANLSIAAGSVVAIVGPSGSGKTTLVRAIQGLYRTTHGSVTIDGKDVSRFAPADLHAQIAVVPQELTLFAGSIGDNIALGLPNADPALVVEAARFVGADSFIDQLPQGYDTRLGDGGTGLSAGQKQLICIARALIRNPRLLILDEATSALDRDTERRLMANLRQAAQGRTIIMVSHRPAPAVIATQVVRVADGHVTELAVRPLMGASDVGEPKKQEAVQGASVASMVAAE